MKPSSSSIARSVLAAIASILTAGCAADTATAPPHPAKPVALPAVAPQRGGAGGAIAIMQRATARYHNLDAAIADGFVFLHGCETRPDEGPAGILYVHFDRLLDGLIDPERPDALLYEPRANGRPRLVGVELAVPYALWTSKDPPELLGATFQPEDEFGVFGLHVWIWSNNPNGLFAESNPRVNCAGE